MPKKITQIVFALLLQTLLFSCATNQAVSVNDHIKIPADIAGIVHAGTTNTAQEYALLDSLDVSWILRTFNWSSIEATEGQGNAK